MHSNANINAELITRFFDRESCFDVEPEPGVVDLAAHSLERGGWKESIAGSEDFWEAARAVAKLTLLPRKGLIVSGAFGCGKTALLRALAFCMKSKYNWVDMAESEHVNCLNAEVWPNWNNDAMSRYIVLDDLGAEASVNEFGVMHEYAGEFIVRYHLRGRGRLFITTNLTPEELETRYTMRVCSRIKELTIPLHLEGEDKREF